MTRWTDIYSDLQSSICTIYKSTPIHIPRYTNDSLVLIYMVTYIHVYIPCMGVPLEIYLDIQMTRWY